MLLIFVANGGAGVEEVEFIRTLGRGVARQQGIPVSLAISLVATQVSMAVIRGTAYAMDARKPLPAF
jgi:hypothetical protein